MNSFEAVKKRFLELCDQYGIQQPDVSESVPDDPCDFTSAEQVRINVKAAGDIDLDYHAAHVFGHYLCNLHEYADCIYQHDISDGVADAIAKMILNQQVL